MTTHIFHVPHADDETLSMGVSILEHLAAGDRVLMVLLTDGAACLSRIWLSGAGECPRHQRRHDPAGESFLDGPLDDIAFSAARRREFIAAADIMGVPRECLSFYTYPDGGMTREQARRIILRMERDPAIPGPKVHHSMTAVFDNHNDHIACGSALEELHREGLVAPPVFYVKRSLWNTLPPDAPVETVAASAQTRKVLEDVCRRVYMNYSPPDGHYGIGYHSVPESFDALLRDFTVRRHGMIGR